MTNPLIEQPLSLEQIKELRELHAKATSGPWETISFPNGMMFMRSATCMVMNNRGPNYLQEIFSDEDYDTKEYDLKLTALVRNSLPALLSMAERCVVLEEALTEASHFIYGEYYYDHPTCVKIRAVLTPTNTKDNDKG